MSRISVKSWLSKVGALLRARTTKKHKKACVQLQLEQLEERWLPSTVTPDIMMYQSAGQAQPAASVGYTGISPAAMRTAYGITSSSGANQVMFGSVAGNGAGQTIAIVDSYSQPNIVSDLNSFDAAVGLPAPPSFTVINQTGGTTLPANAPLGQWGIETSLDVEWAHVIAPGANILLVETNSVNDSDFLAGVATAADYAGVSVVSMSFNDSEWRADPLYDQRYFITPSGHNGVTFVAASGDQGSQALQYWPAVSPNVVGVGGTSLSLNSDGTWASETGWADGGGGISTIYSQPSYQNGVVTQSTTMRTVPDVAMDSDPGTGVSVYDSYDEGTSNPWWYGGGTSLAAPLFAGVIAIADQGRALAGEGTLDGPSQTLPKLYALAGSGAFHDITTGNNGYAAGPGYDLVTGLGSPIANVLIPDLVGTSSTTTPTATTTTLTDNGPNVSINGQSVSFTLSVSPTVPNGETVTLIDTSNNNATVGTGTLSGGTASISVSSLTPGQHVLEAVYSGDSSFAGSASATIIQTVDSLPAVTTQPVSETVNAGGTATFTAAAGGNPAPSVQWQQSTNGGATWNNISGATSTTLTLNNVNSSQNGYEYQAVFTNSAGSATSAAATLTVPAVATLPTVTTQPVSEAVNAGGTATFTAAAGGNPPPSVQWQQSTNGGATWSNISGATSTTLTLNIVVLSQNGYEYAAVFTNSAGSAISSAATLTVDASPVMTAQPVSDTVNPGGTATFTAAASGNPAPNVQWQQSTNGGSATWSNISGSTASIMLTLNNVSLSENGYEYMAFFTNSSGITESSTATLTVTVAATLPTVTTQPVSETVNAGGTATFTAAAGGNPAPSVQWQQSTNGGATWNNISGATSTTLTLNNVNSSQNGYEYLAVFTNSAGSTTSAAATLTVPAVATLPTVTTQPVGEAVNAGGTATFTAAAGGNPPPRVQWQQSTNGGGTWSNISGATSTTLTLNIVVLSQNGYEYAAVFTNSAGSAISSAATLTVDASPVMTAQPVSDTVNPGGTATFTAAASGNPAPSVQWQQSTNGGATWSNISGATSIMLTLNNVSLSENGYEYMAFFTNSSGITESSTATLTVTVAATLPTVTTQPVSETVNAGGTATFTAAAGGNPAPSVQWQQSTNGGATWNNISGATSTTLTLNNVNSSQNGYEYLAVFTNSAGSTTSAAATLTVPAVATLPTVTTQPVGEAVNAGGTATFTAAAGGNPPPSVQWQQSTNGGATWSNISGATSTTLTLNIVVLSQNGYEYAAVFTNSAGSAISSAATLTVDASPVMTAQPVSDTVNPGGTATFTAAASGNPAPSVQWQQSTNGGATWSNISGATSIMLTLNNVSLSENGYEYMAFFTNSSGITVSSAATLTVTTVATAPTVTTQPVSETVNAGGTATFTAAAGGNPAPSVQWQQSTNGGATWSNISGATSTTLALNNVVSSANGYEYLAVFTNSAGIAISSAATLSVDSLPAVTAQPVSVMVNAGGTATFTAAAGGNPTPTVQWRQSTNGGDTWTNIGGATSATFTLNNVVSSQNGYECQAVFTNSVGSAASNAATLTITPGPVVTSISPSSGPAGLDTTVTIAGSSLANATAVTFGSTAATIVSDTGTQIVAVSPAGAAGTVDVTITTAAGVSATSAADRFTFVASVVTNHALPTTINLAPLDTAPVGPVAYSVTVLDPLFTLKTTYGLTLQDGYFNIRGADEKYLLSNNGSNPAGGGWYVLMPTGNLYAWNSNLATTLATIPIATVAASVYYNPSLLTNSTGAPIATSGTNPFYDLKIQLGLASPVIASAYNARGDDEQYLQSTNGSNPSGGGYYVLMPNNKLYAWGGSLAADQLVADFNAAPYSANVYANPSVLTSAALPTAPAVVASLAGSILTLTPANGFDRNVQVTVKAADSTKTYTQSFAFAINETAPNVPAVGPITIEHAAPAPTFNLNATDAQGDSLTYSAIVSGYNPFYDLQQQLGLTQSDLTQYFNIRGQNEKYFQSTNGSNSANGGWYVLMPTDKLYAWDGVSLAATVAQAPVADFTQAPYAGLGNVYDNTAFLYKASAPADPTVASNRGTLFDIKTEFGLTAPDLTQAFNARGQGEKYLQSANGSNSINGGWYVLMPSDKLYAWDGNSLATTLANAPIADFTSDGPVYAEPSLLYAAQPALVNDPLFNLEQQFGLTSADLTQAFNARGQDEKYLHSANGSNSANGGWYVLMPTDKLYAWDGVSLATTIAKAPVADFTQAPYSAFLGSGDVYATPSLLYADSGQTAAVSAVVSSSGVVTLTPSSAFAGTVRVTVTASDGAELTKQSFLFTVTDSAPTVQTVNLANGSSAAGMTTVNYTVATFNGAPAQSAASIAGYNPLFSLKSLYGLTSADIAFNARGQGEKYFLSTNGSNPAGGGWYVLMPTDKLYAWNGSLATTLATGLVADFTQSPYAGLGNVYNNTALLYNATQPAAPSITATLLSGDPMVLAWASGYTGTFQVTLTIGDGAMESQQSFLVTVS